MRTASLVTYRTFRNADPPRILELWNRCANSRGFGRVVGCDQFEQVLFSKPYFDRAGVQLAFEGEQLVGLCHAGFGCNENESGLDRSLGVVCMLMVHPLFRRRGIGRELLSRAQAYLADRGATTQYLGALHPVNPFYLGLYGGSELPGILESDADATLFAHKNNYEMIDTCLIYQVALDSLPTVEDTRLPLLRREVELMVEPWPLSPSWWHACQFGPLVSLRYEMLHRETSSVVGRAWVWEMDYFGRVYGTPTVGVTDFWIEDHFRRQGYGKLLLQSIQKHLRDQRIGLLQIQTMQRNDAARGLFESLGFRQIDTGHAYRLKTS